MIAVDYETYYDKVVSVKTMGPWGYAHDPRTDIYMVSVVGEGISFVGPPSEFRWDRLNGKHLCSHNAGFDHVVTHAAQSRGLIPEFKPASWSCTADLAAYHGLPRALAPAIEQVTGEKHSKDMRNYMSGKNWDYVVKKGRAPEMLDYALKDSEHCLTLWNELSSGWPAHERLLSSLTRSHIYRGVNIDTEKVAKAIEDLTKVREDAADRIPWAGTGVATLSPANVKDYCQLVGIPAPKSLAKDSPLAAEWESAYGHKFEWVAGLRDYRSSNMLLKKFESIRDRTRSDDTMPVYLKYFGGHTGRWSGDSGVNMQNPPQGTMFGTNMRECFVPKPGHKFVLMDQSQIEPRVLAWLVNDRDLLNAVRGGMAIYEAHARATMGWAGGKLKSENPGLYKLAKARVLGLGFGCGWKKFITVAMNLAGVTLTPEESQTTVSQWRSQNPKVCDFWRRLDNGLSTGHKCRHEQVSYSLPSGRRVKWWQPHLDPEDRDSVRVNKWSGQQWNYTWGGKMTENVVQSLGRDIFADQLLKVAKAGIPVLWSCHDEVICEVPERDAADALATVEQIMSTPPDWIPDIPLAAEGSIESFYTK
tara:strand:- start:3870 stop:5630 length:1761 start_codon:yes stop_codon:yes gene_type:complete